MTFFFGIRRNIIWVELYLPVWVRVDCMGFTIYLAVTTDNGLVRCFRMRYNIRIIIQFANNFCIAGPFKKKVADQKI